MAKKAKKRNPQDTTLRNVRAIRKDVNMLGRAILTLKDRVAALEKKTGGTNG